MSKGYTGIKETTDTKEWYLNGQRYRVGGPAIEYSNGRKEWWLNDKLHRTDGPAVERTDGSKAWFIKGKSYTKPTYYKELFKQGLITEEEYFLELV